MNRYNLFIKEFEGKERKILSLANQYNEDGKQLCIKANLLSFSYLVPVLLIVGVVGGTITLSTLAAIVSYKLAAIPLFIGISIIFSHSYNELIQDMIFKVQMKKSDLRTEAYVLYKKAKQLARIHLELSDAINNLKEALKKDTNNMANLDEIESKIVNLNAELICIEPIFKKYRLEETDDIEDDEEIIEELEPEEPGYDDTITDSISQEVTVQTIKPKMRSLRPPKRDKHGKVQ